MARNIEWNEVENITQIFRKQLGINSEEELKYIEKMTLQLVQLQKKEMRQENPHSKSRELLWIMLYYYRK